MKKETTDRLIAKAIEAKVKKRKEQIETALEEMIDTIEAYYQIAPFQFIEGSGAQLGEYCFPEVASPFNRFYPWADNWMGKLFPEAHKAQRGFQAASDVIVGAFLPDDQKVRQTMAEIDDTFGNLAFAAQRFGFVLGVLVGCKAMGATRDELQEKCRGFILPTIAHAQYEAERDAVPGGKP